MSQSAQKGFVLYYDYRIHLDLLSDEERGQLFKALLDYGELGIEPDLTGAALMAFSFIRSQIDRDTAKYIEKCRKRSEAGKQGGRPPKASEESEKQSKAKKANAFDEKQNKAKKADTNTNININTETNTNTDTNINTLYIPPKGGESPAPASDLTPYKEIVEMYHTICTGYPKLRNVSEQRKKAIAARWKEYKQNLDTFRELFELAEASSFLKGKNQKNWTADFNWLMNSENMAKVLEGKYSDKPKGGQAYAEHRGYVASAKSGTGATAALSGFRMAAE